MRTVTVITGGAGGIGRATAKILGKDHHVVLSDVNQGKLDEAIAELQKLNVTCNSVLCDVTDRNSVDDLVARAGEKGKVVSLVHAAGISPLMGDAASVLNVNAVGTVHVNEAFLDIAQKGFVCINVASMAGYFLPKLVIPNRSYALSKTHEEKFLKRMRSACSIVPRKHRSSMAYLLSKNFVIWYSKSAAHRFGEKGARILSVSPGSIDTEMGQLEIKSGSVKILELAAIKRLGTPEEVAEVIAFSASEKAGYLTGVDILCDGGVVAGFNPKKLLSFIPR
jgi:NAD(P)-dependent dehydrogenase (short-subunit alcohol dehydrogenase family)